MPAPDAVLIRPDGYVVWVSRGACGEKLPAELAGALHAWFGPGAGG